MKSFSSILLLFSFSFSDSILRTSESFAQIQVPMDIIRWVIFSSFWSISVFPSKYLLNDFNANPISELFGVEVDLEWLNISEIPSKLDQKSTKIHPSVIKRHCWRLCLNQQDQDRRIRPSCCPPFVIIKRDLKGHSTGCEPREIDFRSRTYFSAALDEFFKISLNHVVNIRYLEQAFKVDFDFRTCSYSEMELLI